MSIGSKLIAFAALLLWPSLAWAQTSDGPSGININLNGPPQNRSLVTIIFPPPTLPPTGPTGAPWVPTSLPGLVAWYDASNAASITLNGSTVAQWNDLGPNHYNAVQGTAANQPGFNATGLNSMPALTFNGTSQNIVATAAAGLFPSSIGYYTVLIATNATGGGLAPFVRGLNNLPAPYYDFTGVAWVGNGTGSFNTASSKYANLSSTNPALYGALYIPGTNTFKDWTNATQSTSVSIASTYYGDNATTLNLGSRPDRGAFYKGTTGEMIVVNALADADRQSVEGYLAWKWGLQANLPAGHPYKTAPPTQPYWTPAQLPGLIAWYDAKNAASITLNGATVAQWNDQSPNHYNAVQGTAANQPTYNAAGLNGYPALTFTSNNALVAAIPSGTLPNGFSYGGTMTSTGATSLSVPINRATGGQPAPYFNWTGNGAFIGNGSANTSQASALPVEPAPTLMGMRYTKSSDNYSEYINGTQVKSITMLATAVYGDTSSALYIGYRNDKALVFVGTVGEVVFDGVMADADRQKLEGYLAWKWGLQANLPAGHPYKGGPP